MYIHLLECEDNKSDIFEECTCVRVWRKRGPVMNQTSGQKAKQRRMKIAKYSSDALFVIYSRITQELHWRENC